MVAIIHHAPKSLKSGDRMDFTLWAGPLPIRWVAGIEDVSPAGFTDRQVRGPYETWVHRHVLERVDETTTDVVDRIELPSSGTRFGPRRPADVGRHAAPLRAPRLAHARGPQAMTGRSSPVAGIGGLSAAAWLAKSGLDVTVLEAHVYPGGCAARSSTAAIVSTRARPWRPASSRTAG